MRNNRRKVIIKSIYTLFATIFIVVSLIYTIKLSVAYAQERKKGAERPKTVYYSYEIQEGDTLWSIAKENKWDECSIRGYIIEVMDINHIGFDITAGRHIIIPIELSN